MPNIERDNPIEEPFAATRVINEYDFRRFLDGELNANELRSLSYLVPFSFQEFHRSRTAQVKIGR